MAHCTSMHGRILLLSVHVSNVILRHIGRCVSAENVNCESPTSISPPIALWH